MQLTFNNKKGIALVTSLMFTLISLTIIMAVMYMVTASTKQSGGLKRYRTVLEASYGGSEVVMKDMMPVFLRNFFDPAVGPTGAINALQNAFSGLQNFTVESSVGCLQAKLQNTSSSWSAIQYCDNSLSPKTYPDFKFSLPATAGSTPYTVYAKIVDTVPGNTDMSGNDLDTGDKRRPSEVEHFPFIYRVEVSAERSSNATEQANISVVYAY